MARSQTTPKARLGVPLVWAPMNHGQVDMHLLGAFGRFNSCIQVNVNPGLINPWLINRGLSPFSITFAGNTAQMGQVY